MSSRRQDQIHGLGLATLFAKHPYLALFQKANWAEYLELLAQIYDLVEETGQQTPYEGVRITAYKFFRDKDIQSVEGRVGQFIVMCIEELKVLKDFHDPNGKRMIELTRAGRDLLRWVEELLAQRVKYSGTGAEILLASLNEALTSRSAFNRESAREHHLSKIREFKEDLKIIEEQGPEHAKLLPMPHSREALFAQAEASALDILAAVEDVKQAIENERKQLAQNYLESVLSSGQTVNSVAEFYERLYQSVTHKSYVQAKNIFSHLDGAGHRFANKSVTKMVQTIGTQRQLPEETVKRSPLNGFQRQFEMSDAAIQEKIRAQLQLLQLQVRYSLAADVKGLQSVLKDVLQTVYKQKDQILDFFSQNGVAFSDRKIGLGAVELCAFERPAEVESELFEVAMEEEERRQLVLALIRAEETTVRQIVTGFKALLKEQGEIRLDQYSFQFGLGEYYVLSEIELFAQGIRKERLESADLTLKLRNHTIVLRKADIYLYTLDQPSARLPSAKQSAKGEIDNGQYEPVH